MSPLQQQQPKVFGDENITLFENRTVAQIKYEIPTKSVMKAKVTSTM